MKRNHRLFRAVSATLAVLLTMLATLSFAACGSRKPIIGILQFGSHESLNNCYDGIMQGLEESGLDLSRSVSISTSFTVKVGASFIRTFHTGNLFVEDHNAFKIIVSNTNGAKYKYVIVNDHG